MNKNGPTERKLIALVSNSTWALYNFRLDVIRWLAKNHYGVLVIAPQDEFAPLLVDEGCQYAPIQFNNRSENPLLDFSLYRQLKKIYSQQRPDLIFHYVIKPNIFGSLAAASCSLPSVSGVRLHGKRREKQNNPPPAKNSLRPG